MNLPISIIFALLLFFGAGWISVHIFHDANLTHVLRILFQNVFKLAGIVILVALGFGVIRAAWGLALAIVLMPVMALYFLEKKVFSIFNSRIKAISTERELFSFSWPLIFVGMAGIVMGFMNPLMLL